MTFYYTGELNMSINGEWVARVKGVPHDAAPAVCMSRHLRAPRAPRAATAARRGPGELAREWEWEWAPDVLRTVAFFNRIHICERFIDLSGHSRAGGRHSNGDAVRLEPRWSAKEQKSLDTIREILTHKFHGARPQRKPHIFTSHVPHGPTTFPRA